jgi:hypothetical protein
MFGIVCGVGGGLCCFGDHVAAQREEKGLRGLPSSAPVCLRLKAATSVLASSTDMLHKAMQFQTLVFHIISSFGSKHG